MSVVILTDPSWIAKETSQDRGSYYAVYRFGIRPTTRCTIDDVEVDPNLVLERLPYGTYECRLPKPTSVVQRQTLFTQNNDALISAVLAVGLVSVVLLAMSKA